MQTKSRTHTVIDKYLLRYMKAESAEGGQTWHFFDFPSLSLFSKHYQVNTKPLRSLEIKCGSESTREEPPLVFIRVNEVVPSW